MESKKSTKLYKIVFAVLIAFFLVLAGFYIRFISVYSYHKIEGASMEPTLYGEDRAYVRKGGTLTRGDTVVFEQDIKDPISGITETKLLIKRVIATEGDEVDIVEENGIYKLLIKYAGTSEFTEPFEPYLAEGTSMHESYNRFLVYRNYNRQPILIGQNQIFALGDHREVSQDSSAFGPVNQEKILGRVDFVVKKDWNFLQKMFYNLKIKFMIIKK